MGKKIFYFLLSLIMVLTISTSAKAQTKDEIAITKQINGFMKAVKNYNPIHTL